jgi:hypothetical protein
MSDLIGIVLLSHSMREKKISPCARKKSVLEWNLLYTSGMHFIKSDIISNYKRYVVGLMI